MKIFTSILTTVLICHFSQFAMAEDLATFNLNGKIKSVTENAYEYAEGTELFVPMKHFRNEFRFDAWGKLLFRQSWGESETTTYSREYENGYFVDTYKDRKIKTEYHRDPKYITKIILNSNQPKTKAFVMYECKYDKAMNAVEESTTLETIKKEFVKGRLVNEKHFIKKDNSIYVIYYVYDENGNCISESAYDTLGNRINVMTSISPSNTFSPEVINKRVHIYNSKKRLIQTVELNAKNQKVLDVFFHSFDDGHYAITATYKWSLPTVPVKSIEEIKEYSALVLLQYTKYDEWNNMTEDHTLEVNSNCNSITSMKRGITNRFTQKNKITEFPCSVSAQDYKYFYYKYDKQRNWTERKETSGIVQGNVMIETPKWLNVREVKYHTK